MANINDLTARWRAVVRQRQELDRLSRELKNGPEAELRSAIMMYLDSQNIPGVKTQFGYVSRTVKTHLEVTDSQALLDKQLDLLLAARESGHPLNDALIIQKTPAKVAFLEHMGNSSQLADEEFNKLAAEYGIKRVTTADLSFRSAK